MEIYQKVQIRTLFKRGVAFVIDFTIIHLISNLVSNRLFVFETEKRIGLFDFISTDFFIKISNAALIELAVFILYFLVFEMRNKQTFGKSLMNLKWILKPDGSFFISFLVRIIARLFMVFLFPFELIYYIINKQMVLHDVLSNSVVAEIQKND